MNVLNPNPETIFTSPSTSNGYTQWNQSVFYLPDALTVKNNEAIVGAVSCKPNAKNPRDLDFQIQVDFSGEISQMQCVLNYRMR